MPASPSKGAASRLRATSAFISSTAASIWLSWLSAASQSDCAMARFTSRSRFRSRSAFASVSRADAERSCASSCCVSSSTSTSPFFTGAPEVNAISETIPARSVLSITPLTAFIEPTALSTGCHVCACTTTVVTPAGGGANSAPIALPFSIPRSVHSTSPATASATRNTINNIRFSIGGMRQQIRRW